MERDNSFDFEIQDGRVVIRAALNARGLKALIHMMPILQTLAEGEKDRPTPPEE